MSKRPSANVAADHHDDEEEDEDDGDDQIESRRPLKKKRKRNDPQASAKPLTYLQMEERFWSIHFRDVDCHAPLGRTFARACSARYSQKASRSLSDSWLNNADRFDSSTFLQNILDSSSSSAVSSKVSK